MTDRAGVRPGRARPGHTRRVALLAVVLLVAACGSSASPSVPGTAAGSSSPPAGGSPATGASPAASAAGAPACPGTAASAPAASAASSAPVGTSSGAPSASGPGWWTGRVFYEAFVRSFADGNGDGVGDIKGLIARLDQLDDGDPTSTTDLGVTGLWLMPIMPSPSYHGYDVTDYRSVQPAYGSLADLRALVAAAHRRGMAVILDMPFNHTSDRNPWFLDAKTPTAAHRAWYLWASSPQGSNWFPLGGQYYYGAFGASMPDLDLRDPAVTAELEAVARFWLQDVGVDGFRLDAAKYLIEDGPATQNTPETHAWWAAFKANIEAYDPGALLLGEVWDTPQVSSSYVPADLDMTFDFGLAGAYVSAADTGDASSLSRVLARVTSLYPTGGFGAFLTNHDMDRVASQLRSDPAKLKLAAGLLLTGPGVPFVYYGEEIGMTGQKPDERIRTPMRWDASSPAAGFSTHAPWEAMSSDPASVNVATEAADPTSLYSWYRDLIRVRAAHPALAGGSYTPVTSTDPAVMAAVRATPTERLLVLANTSAAAVTDARLDLASGPLCGQPAARVVLGSGTATAPTITAAGGFAGYRPFDSLPPRSVTVVDLGS